MIKGNNPSVDTEALMLRVRVEGARLRSGSLMDEARRKRWSTFTNRLPEILDRLNAIHVHLAAAEHRNQPRTQIPARLAKLRVFGNLPAQILLRTVNYLFKQQREVDAAQNLALREMAALVLAAAQDLTAVTKRLSELAEQMESRASNTDKT